MKVRSRKNKNLRLTNKKTFRGHPIQTTHGALCIPYLDRIYDTIEQALDAYPRTMALRVDLRFPKLRNGQEKCGAITDFIRSLQSQIEYDGRRKERHGQRVHSCTVRYVWVRECCSSLNDHYHLLLLFNKDRFNWLGKARNQRENLLSMVIDAWAKVTGVEYDEANGLVYVSKDRSGVPVVHRLDSNSKYFNQQFDELFEHGSYLAKEKTKHFGNHQRNFGTSRK
ncbi:transposase [Vibrio vulnificus]|uniref:inovirus Gp2 family protein n=1 Tax=Vibrio TaxID=662 RepID=UPI000CD05C3F|nr:inovirus Gp2 family protein [Vibrio vulnificus]ELA9535182.1 inovirus Gp2 family protein [Vibrio parahaemolyticus]EHU4848719.1 inovirus Gp2 family protein [Vibrio vulnificus]EJE8736584.1 inovirus Gp2 family protein [Vibrio vulnificus]EKA7351125.1 inovirus Gp2 family protein [Vibrio vulnificus]POC14566.1 transposase [Vibrio vulnificus]